MFEWLLRAIGVPEEPATVHAPVAPRGTPSLARQATIAAIDPATGRLWSNTGYVVAAALLVELSREGRIAVEGTGKKTRLTVRDSTPLGVWELDTALPVLEVGGPGQKVTRSVDVLPSDLRLVDRLLADGALEEHTEKRFGVFTAKRLEPTPSAGREQVVARLRSALTGESIPDEGTAQLISVLTIGVSLKLFVPRKSVNDAYRRAAEIRERIPEEQRALISAVREVRERRETV